MPSCSSVIVPIDVEPDPRVAGVHAGDSGHNRLTSYACRLAEGGARDLFVDRALSAHGDRPMAHRLPHVATALRQTGRRVVVNPGTDALLLPRYCVAALAGASVVARMARYWPPAAPVRQGKRCLLILWLSITYAGRWFDARHRVHGTICFTEAANAASAMKQSRQALSHVGANRRHCTRLIASDRPSSSEATVIAKRATASSL